MSEYFPGKVIKKYRELKGWSQQKLAEHWPKKNGEIGVEWHYVQKVEYGISNVVDQPVLRKLSDLLDIPLWEFGYSEHDPYSAVKDPSDLDTEHDKQNPSDQAIIAQLDSQVEVIAQRGAGLEDTLQAATQGVLMAMRNLEQEGIDTNRSRRFFLQMLSVSGAALTIIPQELLMPSLTLATRQSPITNVSTSTIENLATITQQYRSLQLAGLATEDALRSHINLIQNALESTINDKLRCDLWRILAQSQILARHSITKKQELGRARTWNEAAIASAQYSGDAFLLGAAIGHLSHLYLIWQHDPPSARKLLDQAQEYTHSHPINGWFTMVGAAIAAEEKNCDECETAVVKATEIVHAMPRTAEYTDLFYTDFNIPGTDAFTGNCLLKVGKPTQALERLTSINLELLAENRHASTFYDIASVHAATGELEEMQAYAFRSIDKALATNRLYILPRFVTLAQKIQAKDRYEPHAAAIAEYAHVASHR